MNQSQSARVCVIIPNWNGSADLPQAIDSILSQSVKDLTLVIVDNGSTDTSLSIIEAYQQKDTRVHAIWLDNNYGYTGGVNPGFDFAIRERIPFAAPFNNDAVADKDWLKHLLHFLETHPKHGIAACSLLHMDGKTIDSTADQYTTWGIPFPRGRDEAASQRRHHSTDIFGASGGASMYRVAMLKKIGGMDRDFFAYYEDIDISFRAQLAGWKVAFVPDAVVYHSQGKTSNRLGKKQRTSSGANTFTTKQYMKNLPFVLVKNVPGGLFWRIAPRFCLAYTLFFFRAIVDGRGWSAIQGALTFWVKLPKKLLQRRHIQKTRIATNAYIWSILLHDLPPNAHKLRALRALWWRLTGKAKR